MKPATLRAPLTVLALAALLAGSLAGVGLLNPAKLARAAVNVGVFVGGMFPPDLSVLPDLGLALVETIEIAFAGTALGALLALPLALAATPLLAGQVVAGPVRLLLAVVRTVPSLLWAILFVVAVGLGPGAGALAIAVYSLGYLGKILYEVFEGVDPEVLEAVRSTGSNRLQLARFVVLPEAANAILAQLIFMFEYNVRASSILGLVGAGGIGYYLMGYIQLLQYDRLLTALLATLAVVIVIDRISARLRAAFLLAPGSGAAP